ncbi:MAG: flagellar FlbD family protein [Candidatus Hinthialibacter sp.]
MISGSPDNERIERIREELSEEFQKPISDVERERRLPGMLFRRNGVIHLTKLNNTPFMMNAELIETVEATPDTIISLVTGRKYIVRESVEEVREKCISYKREIYQNWRVE